MELFVNQIRGHRVGGDLIHQINNPDLDTVENAIRNLGKHSYAIELWHIAPKQEERSVEGKKIFMGVSGGARNAYSIFVHDSNYMIHVLNPWTTQASRPDIDELLLDELPSATLDDAIQVARTFAVDGQLDKAFQWQSHLGR